MKDKNIHVLLIEDDEGDFIIARSLLEECEDYRFKIGWCQDFDAGITYLEQTPADAVLLDLSLPDSQGWETFAAFHEKFPRTPVILLTGLADEDLSMRAVHEGAQDYLLKSHLSSYVLSRSISYSIERRKTEDQLERYAERVRLRNLEMENDLRMAREVQLALMPQQYPAFPRSRGAAAPTLAFAHMYRPSQTLGGDFFNILSVSDTLAGVFMCDVMGHGMRAALVTAIIRGLLEQLRGMAVAPGRFLGALNRGIVSILDRTEEIIFASAIYMVVEAETGEVTLANAGHPAPLHLSHASGKAALLIPPDAGPRGCVLGVKGDSPYPEQCFHLNHGDRLLIYTDGLTEAQSPDAEQFGTERILASAAKYAQLEMPEFLQSITHEAEEFTGESGFDDDVCMLSAMFSGAEQTGDDQ
jgi:serine phosphatase RsbU (regulator of sigma subunit)